MSSGVNRIVLASSKGKSQPTQAQIKAVRTGTKGSAPRPANLPKKK